MIMMIVLILVLGIIFIPSQGKLETTYLICDDSCIFTLSKTLTHHHPIFFHYHVHRQPSDSHGNDGGGFKKVEPSPKGVTHKKTSSFSPTSAIAPDLQSCSGSNSTPSTPPPRHSARKMMSHDEVWYQKWWMCGFTDALNLNPKC